MGLLNQEQQPGMVNVQDAQMAAKQKMDKLKRLVLAGQKVLYTPPASEQFLKYINPEQLPESVGEVAAMVVSVLIGRGGEQGAPPDLVMPAGVTLVGDILSYASDVFGVEVNDELTKAAIQAFLGAMTRGVQQSQQGQQQGQQPQGPQMPQAQPQQPGVMA